jgi:type II secretory pathway pseudopilin PulG
VTVTRPRGRAALTLLETLVAAAIATVVLASLFLFFNLSYRSQKVTATARALQTALLVEERLADDLGRVVPAGPSLFRSWPDRPGRLGFYVYDPAGPRGEAVPVRAVVWSLEKPRSLLVRTWSGARQPVGVSPLMSLTFHPFMSPTGPLVRVVMEVGSEASEPDARSLVHTFLVRAPFPRRSMRLPVAILGPVDPSDAPSDQELPLP